MDNNIQALIYFCKEIGEEVLLLILGKYLLQ